MNMNINVIKKKFIVCLILAIPIFLLTPFMGIKLSFQPSFAYDQWVVVILATIIFWYGGSFFFMGALSEIKAKEPGMMTLVSMAILVSYLYSCYGFIVKTFINPHSMIMNFFWEFASLVVIMLLGHVIEALSLSQAGSAVKKMAALLPNTAHLYLADGTLANVPIQSLKRGSLVLVRPGEKIPADGLITKGTSNVNEAFLTGEAKPVLVKPQHKVIGGGVNGDSTLTLKVSEAGQNSYLAQVINLVKQSQLQKSKVQSLADKVASWLFYAAVGVGVLAFIIWTILVNIETGLTSLVSVLVIACPHALGLAIPLVTARSTYLAASNGLLIRHRDAIEAVKKLDIVFMDKTGTLTKGQFSINELVSLNPKLSDQQVLEIMASLEATSDHPLATSLLKYAKQKNINVKPAKAVRLDKGIGVFGDVNNKHYGLVSVNYLKKQQLAYDKSLFEKLSKQGNSISYLISNNQVLGLVAQGDQLRANSKALITFLKNHHIQVVMLTGDNYFAAQHMAQALGNIKFNANLLPVDKAQIIKKAEEQGNDVMMVGDGVNDAPSLAQANIGVAIGAGTDVAIDVADVVLIRNNPLDIVTFIELATATNKKMVENLWWGAGYNIIAIPLAAGILVPIHIVLSPAFSGVLMALSTVVVSINSLTLKIKK